MNEINAKDTRKDTYFLIIVSVIICIVAYNENDRLYTILSLTSLVCGVFINPILPLSIMIATAPMGLGTSAMLSMVKYAIMILPMLMTSFSKKSFKISIGDFLVLFSGCFIILVSLCFGVDTKVTTAAIQMIIIFAYFIVCNLNARDTNLIITGLILAGSCVAAAVIIQLITNSAEWLWGNRLTYSGSVRTLSTAIAFPIFVLMYNVLTRKFKNKSNFVFCFIIVAVLILLLIATYSRGVLVALIVSIAYVIFSQFKKLTLAKISTYTLIFACLSLFLLNADLSTDMMFNNIDSAGGRNEVWGYFFERLEYGGFTGILFGFGPGDILRITAGTSMDGFYSHSAFLDYFFTYGLLGAIFILGIIFKAFVEAKKNKNVFAMGLLILAILMYATHNNSASLEMHLYLALVFGISKNKMFVVED